MARPAKSQIDLDALVAAYVDDLPLFAEQCLKIRTKKGGPLEPLIFNRAQLYLHEQLERQREEIALVRAIVLKGRQLGASTYIAARNYHGTAMRFGTRAFLLTHLADATNNLFAMIERFHDNNDPFLKPATGAANAKELSFPGLQSGFKVGTAGSVGVGRSDTIQRFHGSECGLWPNAEVHATGVMEAVPLVPDTEIILESTAQGLGNFFSDTWKDAVAGKSLYRAIFMPWFWGEDYRIQPAADFELTSDEAKYRDAYGLDLAQMAWRRNKLVELKEDWRFQQEYPANPEEAFQSSGDGSYIKPIDVAAARARKVTVEAYVPIIIGIDPARGGRDATAVIDRQGRRAGAHVDEEWRDADVTILVGKTVNLIKRLRPLRVVIDATEGIGKAMCDMLTEQGFGKIVVPVLYSSAAIESDLYANKRAEMWASLKDWLGNPLGVQVPDSDDLQAQICAPVWGAGATHHNRSGALLIEPKEHVVKRIGRSPDKADALAQTFAVPINPVKPKVSGPKRPAVADRSAGY